MPVMPRAYSVTKPVNYYPFGMVMNQTNPGTSPENKLLYNSKEIQDDVVAGKKLDWYDYGARFYDPQIARWHSVDPLAEKYYPISPYAYVGNNPIVRIDPDGRDWYEDKEGNILFDPNLSKDNHETYMQENGIEGKYWGTTGFSINEESGLSIAYFSDGTSKEGLWQLNEVVVEAEMGESARTRMNAESLGIYDAQNRFLETTGKMVETAGNAINRGGYAVALIPGMQPIALGAIGLGSSISAVGSGLGVVANLSVDNQSVAGYKAISTGVSMGLEAGINRVAPGGGTLILTRGWLDGTKGIMDYSVKRRKR